MAGDLAGDPLGALDVDVADPDLGALGGKPRRDRRADAAGAAGDQRLPSPPASSGAEHRGPRESRSARRLLRARASSDPIPIVGGTGALGAGLALRWARAGARRS